MIHRCGHDPGPDLFADLLRQGSTELIDAADRREMIDLEE
jgi:hypothetical protein